MSILNKKIVVQLNAADLGRQLSLVLKSPLVNAQIIRFADTETDIFLDIPFVDVAGLDVILVAQFGGAFASWSVNDFLMILCFLAKRLRQAGVAQLTCVLPYLPYARQDAIGEHGGIGLGVVYLDLLKAAGVELVFTVDLHNPMALEATAVPVVDVQSTDFWADIILDFIAKFHGREYVLVAPDRGASKAVGYLADKLGFPACFIEKVRTGVDQALAVSSVGEVKGRYALLLDDIIDTGRTAAVAANLVLQQGAIGASAFFTHAVFSATSLAVVPQAPFDFIYVADTIHKSTLSYENVINRTVVPFMVNRVDTVLQKLRNQNISTHYEYRNAIQ